VLVLRGSVTETRSGEETDTYGPSTLLFRRADEPHSYHVAQTGRTRRRWGHALTEIAVRGSAL